MTSVPKPLKFLRPHYETLKTTYEESKREKLADVISVLAITAGKEGERESLKYRLQGTKVKQDALSNTVKFVGGHRYKAQRLKLTPIILKGNVEEWGHEYLRNLAGEIGEEYQLRRETDQSAEDLLALVSQILPYHMKHNSGVHWECAQPMIRMWVMRETRMQG